MFGKITNYEAKKWREKYVHSNWLNINEDLAYKKIISCNNASRLKAIGKYLFKTKCKWESKVKGAYNMTEICSQSENRNRRNL
jgi:hypothetical protein